MNQKSVEGPFSITKVSEDDPDVVARYVQIERDGGAMRAYYAAPRMKAATAPCVVLAMHIYGVDGWMRDTVRRFAKAGFAAVVADLYARFDAPSGDGATDYKQFYPFAQRLEAATVDPDLRASAVWLREQFPDSKAAVAGFCMGGVMALRRTIGYADLFSAAAIWYGAIVNIDPRQVEIPIVASYGADDTSIPVAGVEAFRSGLRVPNDIVVYPGAGHAFCDYHRSSYEPKAAEDSWRRSIESLRIHLAPNA